MKLTSESVHPESENWGATRDLYERAFPAEERAPLDNLTDPHLQGDFRAFFCEGEFCGLAYMLMDEKNCYLFYLAVEDAMRGKGVGSEMMREIKKIYPRRTIVLEMETLDPEAENYEERLRRDRFYRHNDLKHTDIVIEQCGVPYQVLSSDERYTLTDYREMWEEIARRQGKEGEDAEEFLRFIFGDTLRE